MIKRTEAEALARALRDLLADSEAGLSISTRYRYEGALVGLEAVLGHRSTLAPDIDLTSLL